MVDFEVLVCDSLHVVANRNLPLSDGSNRSRNLDKVSFAPLGHCLFRGLFLRAQKIEVRREVSQAQEVLESAGSLLLNCFDSVIEDVMSRSTY